MAGRGSSLKAKLEAYKSRVLGTIEKSVEHVAEKVNTGKKRKPELRNDSTRSSKKRGANKSGGKDPSTLYLRDPRKAPICGEAVHLMKRLNFGKFFNIVLGEKIGWRTTAKLSVRGNPPVIGLFAPGSHKVVSLLESETHHPSINEIVKSIDTNVKLLKIPGYDGVNPGGLSYICCNVELVSGKVQLVCVFNTEFENEVSTKMMRKLVAQVKKDSTLLHSAWLHCNPSDRHNNAIYSHDPRAWNLIDGEKCIVDTLNEVKVGYSMRPQLYFPPFVFRQANIAQFSKIVSQIRKWIIKDCKVVELYAGVGTIGFHVLDLVSSLDCSDENPNNEECFKRTLNELPYLQQKKATYYPLSASKIASGGGLDGAEILIVDPPRKGLDPEVLEAIKNSHTLKRVVYVSCGFKAFSRDCVEICSYGFQIIHGEGYLLFPGSNHIETLAVFEK